MKHVPDKYVMAETVYNCCYLNVTFWQIQFHYLAQNSIYHPNH